MASLRSAWGERSGSRSALQFSHRRLKTAAGLAPFQPRLAESHQPAEPAVRPPAQSLAARHDAGLADRPRLELR